MAAELGPRNIIRVNAILAGQIDTAFIANSPESILVGVPDDPAVDYPIGRTLQPQDVADAVFFWASSETSAITGSMFVVDAGYAAREL